jgi:hypothetical protein
LLLGFRPVYLRQRYLNNNAKHNQFNFFGNSAHYYLPTFGAEVSRGSLLSQPPPQQVEGLVGGPLSYSGAVAAEGFFYAFGFGAVGEGYVDEAYGLFFGAAGGAVDAGERTTKWS